MKRIIIIPLMYILYLTVFSSSGIAFAEQSSNINSMHDLGLNSKSALNEILNIKFSDDIAQKENGSGPNTVSASNNASSDDLKDNSAKIEGPIGHREAIMAQAWPSLTDYVLLPSGAQKDDAFHVVVIGDSIAWGNGLKTENKYYYIVADWLQKVLNRPVEVKVYAHSGATITAEKTCDNIDPEFNSGCPTLMDQANSIQNPDDVDLILVSGGINDIDIWNILDINIPTIDLQKRCADIKDPMDILLRDLLNRCGNAEIIVTDYYPLVSEDTKSDLLLELYEFVQELRQNGSGDDLDESEIKAKLIEKSNAFKVGTTMSLSTAVAQADNGANRISLANINFESKNCYDASDTWLWKLVWRIPLPKIDDEKYDYRNSLCDYLEKYDVDRVNAIGHPNRNGAKEYARAIESVITGDEKMPEYIALSTYDKEHYICADLSIFDDNIVADRTRRNGWETFRLIDLGNRYVALQAFNGKYVCALNGGGDKLVANRPWISDWEKFLLIDLGEGNVALCTFKGQYVCAENGGGGEVVANRDKVLGWETFKLANLERKVALQAAANNKYVCAEDAGQKPLIANRDWVAGWETFGLIDLGEDNDKVAIKAAANNKIVCAETAGMQSLKANRDAIDTWETFELKDLGDNNIALKAAANNKYVCADEGGQKPLIANRDAISKWETFKLITDTVSTQGTVVVNVKNAAGTAIPNALIKVTDGMSNPTATTDSNGQATITCAKGTCTVQISAIGFVPKTETWSIAAGSNSPKTVTLDAVIPAVTLTLYVRDGSTTGPIVPGATVSGTYADGTSFSQLTNSAGYVTLTGKPGTWQFTITKNGYPTKKWPSDVLATKTMIAYFDLQPPVTLTLYVRDGSTTGPIVSGATVSGTYADGTSFSQLTNSAGYVTLTGKPGTWQFTITKSGYPTKKWPSDVLATKTMIAYFDSQPPVTLTLYVRDGSTTGPIVPGATVSGTYADGTSFSQVTNSAGYVTLTGKPGTWQFTIAKSGYPSKSWPSDILVTKTMTAYFDATPQATVTVTVKNAEGTIVIPNAQITVKDGAGNTIQRTTSNGQFTITGVSGTWTATISAAGFVTKTETWSIAPGSSSRTVNLMLENAVVLVTVKNAAGTIVIPNAQITVEDAAGITKQATTDSNGQTVITGVSGTWQYSVSATGFVTKTGTWQVAPSPASNSQVVNLQVDSGTNRPPTIASIPSGPTTGSSGLSYSYSTSANDPDGDQVKYTFDWGDGTTTTGLVASGTTASASHSWSVPSGKIRSCNIRAKATDEHGMDSSDPVWSNPLIVTITGPGEMATVPITVSSSWSGQPIQNALIKVIDGAGNNKQATTGSAGQATITGVSGTWQYTISASGYITAAGTVQIAPPPSGTSVSFNLIPVGVSWS